MLPIQILLNNLLYDFSQSAITTDNMDSEYVEKPKRWAISFIRKFMIFLGPVSSIFDVLTFFIMLLVFRVNAVGSANVYVTIKARRAGRNFTCESGWMTLKVREEKAEIGHLVVLSHPYTTIGKTLSAEATIKGLRESTGLKLEFWVESPSGKSEEQVTLDIKDLSVGEEARYTVEFTPKETGHYMIYAYLYAGWRSLGSKTNSIYAQKP